MEAPVYQFLAAKLHNLTGVDLLQSGRLINIASSAAVIVFLWHILFLLTASVFLRAAAVLLYGLSPSFLYWSQTVMIETFSAALCLGAFLCALEYLKRGRVWPLGLGAVLAVFGALAKSTTFAVFALVIFAYFAFETIRFAWRKRAEPAAVTERVLQHLTYGIGLLAPALLIAIIWVDFSDHVKEASPLTQFLTSEALRTWNFGGGTDRLQTLQYLVFPFRDTFPSIFSQFLGYFWPILVLPSLGAAAVMWRRNWELKLISIIGFFSGPQIFANLYETHYYYWIANSLFLITFVAAGLDDARAIWLRMRHHFNPVGQKLLLGAAVISVPVAALGASLVLFGFFLERTESGYPAIEAIGEAVQRETGPNDVLMIFGFDWNPAIQFYSDRDAIMERTRSAPWPTLEFAVQRGVEVDAILFCRDLIQAKTAILSQPPLDAHEYRFAGSAGFCHLHVKS